MAETRIFMRERPWDPSMRNTELRTKLAQAGLDMPETVIRNMEAIKTEVQRHRKVRLLEIETEL